MIDSGIVCNLITKILANGIIKTTPLARWIITKQDKDLKKLSNETIKVLGKIATTVTHKDWTCEESCLKIMEDGHKLILGRDLFNSFRLAVVQKQVISGKSVNNVDKSTCTLKLAIESQFPYLVSELASQRLIQ